MIDLGLNQYKIKEIKYEVKEGKTVIFKFNNFNLEDVEIVLDDVEVVEETKEENTKIEEDIVDKTLTEEEKCEKCEKPKELHDYEPFSCLKAEKGMQETLDASRKREWKEDVITKPSKPTETGNALIPVDNTLKKSLKENESIKPLCATAREISKFIAKQKEDESKTEEWYTYKQDEKVSKALIKAKKIIDDYIRETNQLGRDEFEKRLKKNVFIDKDPNDVFSNIKSLNELIDKLEENKIINKEEKISSLKEKDEAGLKKIIDVFKEENKE